MPLDDSAACTVCIPTYNQSRYLRPSVKSVAEQTSPVRLLVSNDCSPDDTADVIGELQETYSFEAVNHSVNRGISKHLLWLLQQPQTRYIMRLDSDDFLHPDYVRVLSELMDRHPKTGYAHCAITEVDSEGKKRGTRRLARTREFEDAEDTLRRWVRGYQVAANLLLFRREALADAGFGGGAENLNFFEDYDLSIRIADAGWGNGYSGEVFASYRVHEGPERPPVERKIKEVRGLTTIFTGSLATAFRRRGWSEDVLRERRVELALACSDILDQAVFTGDERERLVNGLEGLANKPAANFAFGDSFRARTFRRSLELKKRVRQGAKQRIKALLFNRE